jgi:protein gp37
MTTTLLTPSSTPHCVKSGRLSPNDLVLVCGDFNLTNVNWAMRNGTSLPSNVTSMRESIIIDDMAACDMGQVNTFANQFGVFFLSFIFQ